jgi:hypothetical protein
MTPAKRDQAWVGICEEIEKAVNTSLVAGIEEIFDQNAPPREKDRVEAEPQKAEDRQHKEEERLAQHSRQSTRSIVDPVSAFIRNSAGPCDPGNHRSL